MVPSSRLHHWVNAHFGNGWVGCSARETGNLAKKLFQTVSGPVLEFTKKSFPRHKTALLERTSVPEMKAARVAVGQSASMVNIALGAVDKALVELKTTGRMSEAQKGSLSREMSDKIEQVQELNARSGKYNLPRPSAPER